MSIKTTVDLQDSANMWLASRSTATRAECRTACWKSVSRSETTSWSSPVKRQASLSYDSGDLQDIQLRHGGAMHTLASYGRYR
ncbi:hypothetical protein SMC87_004136 [Cronobacter dublinensis]|nr:hypothetical protein [Cronobacter dublinensis]NCH72936.1 hypothetical protein [Cronobacter dublinensis]